MTAGPKGGPAPKGEVNLTAEKKQATAALPDNGLLGKSHAISPPPLEPPPFTVKDVSTGEVILRWLARAVVC